LSVAASGESVIAPSTANEASAARCRLSKTSISEAATGSAICRRNEIKMMDIGRLDPQEQNGGDRRAAERDPQQAPVRRARPQESRPAHGGKRGHKPDPVAELAQEYVRRFALGGIGPSVVVRAELRQPTNDHRT
jgi:hypothetical protein